MVLYTYGDIEVSLDELYYKPKKKEEKKSKLEGTLLGDILGKMGFSYKKKEIPDGPAYIKNFEEAVFSNSSKLEGTLLGYVVSKLKGLFHKGKKDVVAFNGDIIGFDINKKAGDEALALYLGGRAYYENKDNNYDNFVSDLEKILEKQGIKLNENNKDVIIKYADLKGKAFFTNEEKALENIVNVYADLLFDEKLALTEKSAAGAYPKIFKQLNELAKRRGIEIAFILGNHDLDYKLFKKRYNEKKYKHLHFIDREVKNVGGYRLAGFGGSPEVPPSIQVGDKKMNYALSGFASYTYNSEDVEKAAKEFIKKAGKVDALVFHKSYSKAREGAEVLEGSFPKEDFTMNDDNGKSFMKSIDDIIKALNPDVVIGGHWHDGLVFEDKRLYINPGQRGIIRYDWKGYDWLNKPKIKAPKPAKQPEQKAISKEELLKQLEDKNFREEYTNSLVKNPQIQALLKQLNITLDDLKNSVEPWKVLLKMN